MRAPLTEPFSIGSVEIANRVILAPLAGIGNWFVRTQARRHGAGMAVSEMVSSFALHYGNERTLEQILVIKPDEHPVSVQLFGYDPSVMESAARVVAEAGADIVDINMGCPVKKVCKTGAGAALLGDPDLAIELARAAQRGSGLPVTVKLRSGLRAGDHSGYELALALADCGAVAAIGFHPRPATVQHQGRPDYVLARRLAEQIEIPMVISGGLADGDSARRAYEESGADAVMIARGSFGNPWLFEELTGSRSQPPSRAEVLDELLWLIERAEQHFGMRAVGWLRKTYGWYAPALGLTRADTDRLNRLDDLEAVRALLAERPSVEASQPGCQHQPAPV